MSQGQRRVAVVGAGISGLTAAWRLQQLGHDVVVLEAADHVGGKLSSFEREGFRIGRGAGAYSGSYSAFLALVDQLGLGARVTSPKAVAGVMKHGRPHWFRGSGIGMLVDFARTPLISMRSKLTLCKLLIDVYRQRRFIDYADPAGCARLDTETVGQYCDRRLNPELRDNLIVPLMCGVWVADGNTMSSTDLYVLIAKFLGSGLRGHVGGIDFLPRALSERLDVRVSTPVAQIDDVGDGVRVVWTEQDTRHEDIFDGVVLSMAAPDVPPVYPAIEPELKDILLGRLKQANYAVLRVALTKRPDIDAIFLAVPDGELTGVGSIAFEHNISPDVAPPGKGLVAVFSSATWADSRLGWSDEDLTAAVFPDLEKVIPGLADLVQFVEITRWTPATLWSEQGMYQHIERLHAIIDDGRWIQHAGDYLSVPSVEGSVVSGETAARRLTAAFDRLSPES